MEIPGRESSPEWQAHSLFSEERTDRTYFFSPWSDYLFGYRDGNMKFIYNATLDDYEVYDLARDPEERFNRIADYPQTRSSSLSRLAAWVQHQERLFQRLILAD
jgi:hypothetical protein